MDEMIAISGLTKRFGPLTAVDGITLSVRLGEVLGFLGPNGAGKSTTMRMITGYLAPTAGTVKVCGYDVAAEPIAAQRRIGYMPEGAPLYGDMTPTAFLNFIAGIRGLAGEERRRRIEAAVAKLQIADVMHQPIETLSKGYKRRVGLAQSILHDPDILILDEPTDGLDPNQKHQVRTLIRDMGRDKAIVISTHILEEVEAVCTRAVIIAKGRIVFDGSPAQLQARSTRHNAVSLDLRSELVERAKAAIAGLPGVLCVEDGKAVDGRTNLVVVAEKGCSILDAVNQQLRQTGLPVEGIFVEQGQLDEVFRKLTT